MVKNAGRKEACKERRVQSHRLNQRDRRFGGVAKNRGIDIDHGGWLYFSTLT